jgi:hypothetical protein
MARVQVYSELPAAGATSNWKQILQVNGSSVITPLTLGNVGADYHWCAAMNGDSWLDPFQSPPGAGFLSMLAYAYNAGHDSLGTIGTKAYDMRGARFCMEVRAENLRLGKQTNLFFWIQFRDIRAKLGQGRYVNTSYLKTTVDSVLGYTAPFERATTETRTTGFVPLVVDFDVSRPWDWIHNGSGPLKTDIYDDNPSRVLNCDQVWRYWDWNCGILAVYPTTPAASDYPVGELDIRKMTLEVDDTLNDVTVPPPVTLSSSTPINASAAMPVTVANGPGHPTDWLGVYPAGAAESGFVDWLYLNGTRSAPATGLTGATVPFTAPAMAGNYIVKLFANNTFTNLATSNTIIVQ